MNKKIKTLATKEEIKTLAIKAVLKAEQGKIVKLKTYDLSLFIGQSTFSMMEYLILNTSTALLHFKNTRP